MRLVDFLFDEVDDLAFEVDAVEGVDFLNSRGACDIHLGHIVTDDIQPNEIEAELL